MDVGVAATATRTRPELWPSSASHSFRTLVERVQAEPWASAVLCDRTRETVESDGTEESDFVTIGGEDTPRWKVACG